MKNLKRILISILCLTVILSMTPFFESQTASAASAKRVEIEIIDHSSDIVSGYYIEYKINDIVFRSDTAGQRINQLTWEHMSDDQKKVTISTFGGRQSDLQEQFGSEYSSKMNKWYNDITGWTEANSRWKEKIIKEYLPSYYEYFEDIDYIDYYLTPECIDNINKYDEVTKRYDTALEYYGYAYKAYVAMCNAQVVKQKVAIMSLSGDLIQLITDRCLVPNITPSGSGLISTSIAGTCFDYISSITGIVDDLQDYVVGKRVRAEDASAVISDCDEMISKSMSFINTCLNKAQYVVADVDDLYIKLESEYNANYQLAEASEADLMMSINTSLDDVEADGDITAKINEYDQKISNLKSQEPEISSEEYDAWKEKYDAAVSAKNSYLEEQHALVYSDITSIKTEYLGNSDDEYFTESSSVGTLSSSYPDNPELTNPKAAVLMQPDKGTSDYTNDEYDQAKQDAETYITNEIAYVEGLNTYAESARTLSSEGTGDCKTIYSKVLALNNAGVYTEDIEKIMNRVLLVMEAAVGKGDTAGLAGLRSKYTPQTAIFSIGENIKEDTQNISDNDKDRESYIDYLEKDLDLYKDAVESYEDAVSEIDGAYEAFEDYADTLPSYVKDQEVQGSLSISDTSELSNISTQSQVDTYANQISTLKNNFDEYGNAAKDSVQIAKFKYNMYDKAIMDNKYELYTTFGLSVSEDAKWSDIETSVEPEVELDTERCGSALRLLYQDFNGRQYSNIEMIKYFADLSDNADTYKTTIKKEEIDAFNTIKNAVAGYNMGAHSYTYNIEHPQNKMLLMSSGNLSDIDPRTELVMPLINEISTARKGMAENIQNVSVDFIIPGSGTNVDGENKLKNENLALSNTDGFILDGIRAVDNNDNFITDRLDTGDNAKFRIYYHVAGDYCMDNECIFNINKDTAYNGNDIYGEYITTNEVYTIKNNSNIVITSQPADVAYDIDGTCEFSVSAKGENLRYQWMYVYGDNDEYAEPIEGETNRVLIFNDIDEMFDGTKVLCEISDNKGYVRSDIATAICNAGIDSQPDADIYYQNGNSIEIKIQAKGKPTRYEWYEWKDGYADWKLMESKTTNTITISNPDSKTDGSRYYCTVYYGLLPINSNYFTLMRKPVIPGPDKVSLSYTSCTYDGSYKKPKATIKDTSGSTLKEGTDYNLAYTSNKSAGTGKVTVTYMNSYSGTATATFTIKPKSLKSSDVSLSDTEFTYTGKTIKPAVTIKGLAKDMDYTLSYKNNTKVGNATVTIKGKASCTGTVSKTFKINPKLAAISKLTSGKKKLTVKMTTKPSSKAASTYQIAYKLKGSSTWKYTTTTSSSKTIKSLKKGKTYYIKVRSYKTVSKVKYYGKWSAEKLSKKIK